MKNDLVQLLKSPGKDKMFGDSYEYKTFLAYLEKSYREKALLKGKNSLINIQKY